VDRRSLDLLGLPAIRERLAGHASFAGGRRLALDLAPSADPEEVARRQAETTEAILLRWAGAPSPAGAHDVREAVAAAAHGGTLDVPDLEEVAATVAVALEVRDALLSRAEDVPLLAAEAGRVDAQALREVAAALTRALDTRGGLLDAASAELARVRRELARARERAAALLRDLAVRLRPHLQEEFVTERGGRPVLAVKAASRSAVAGLVHDTSGSGQTLFVEPLALVEENNRTRELEAAERREVERVLAGLSRLVGERADALARAVDALAVVDLALARAELSLRWDGCEVEAADGVWLEAARHPLLDPAAVVPIDLPLGDLAAVVVSGPNAGGKTVALKTLGLMALLHQCGLRPPARRARLPVFDCVLADIGDEQSIERSLSTFSGHVRALVAILEQAGPRSLVLLDEIAAGTDPAEGAALATAVLERLMDRGARVMATSHLSEVREWAAATPGAANAAVGFDARALAPTYEVRLGEPGASHALAVAERFGLPAEVLDAARGRLTPERRTVADLLLEADAARAAAREELERAACERAGAAEARARAEALERDLQQRIARSRARADEERRAARREAERELRELSADLAALRAEIRAARRAESERTRAGATERERDRRLGAASEAASRAWEALERLRAPLPAPGPVRVGDRVTDSVLGVAGTVVAIEGAQADVQGASARVRVPLERLVVDAHVHPAPPRPGRVDVSLPPEASGPEIDVRGRRAEEARAAVRARVDAASLAGRERLRVIHGRGTGALRAAVREELARHPLVVRVEPAPPAEGGDGATLVYLAEGASG
jgi:DNA mismatch repair protein MutS2